MYVLPFHTDGDGYGLFIGLQEENIGRIREYDPVEIPFSQVPFEIREYRKLRILLIGYVTPLDVAHLTKLIEEKAPLQDALRFLSRGFKFRPDMGDHDGPWLGFKPGSETTQ